jgi:hypothetical protein
MLVKIENKAMKELATFSKEDYESMHAGIESEFGHGEKFHIISEKEEIIKEYKRTDTYDDGTNRAYYETLGRKVSITGYFDSQESIYGMVYAKYLKDNRLYKNGKAGTIICVVVNTNYSKKLYFENQE